MTLVTKDPRVAALHLKKGVVVALPTETVYGLGASINQPEALSEIFRLKNRPQDNPLIVHALDLKMVESFAVVTDDFRILYEQFMPGPLSVLLENQSASPIITRGLSTVAVRIPSCPLFQEVLKELNEPIAAPSANLSGKPSSTCVDHVLADFSPQLPLILDGGPSSGGIESTIIRVYHDHGVILRPGLITQRDLEAALSRPFIFATPDAQVVAPGMKYRHYAPTAKIELIDSYNLLPPSDEIMVLSVKVLSHKHYEPLTSANIYKAFRKADLLGLKKIYIVIDETLNEGLINRIKKACS